MILKVIQVDADLQIVMRVPECGNGFIVDTNYYGYRRDGEWYPIESEWFDRYYKAFEYAYENVWYYRNRIDD